jgi:hypothetical protein
VNNFTPILANLQSERDRLAALLAQCDEAIAALNKPLKMPIPKPSVQVEAKPFTPATSSQTTLFTPSMRQAITEGVAQMPREFTANDLRLFIETKYPKLALDRPYAAKTMVRIAGEKELMELVEGGKGRRPAKFKRIGGADA